MRSWGGLEEEGKGGGGGGEASIGLWPGINPTGCK